MAMLMACPTFLKGNIVTAMKQGYTCPHFDVEDASIDPICRNNGVSSKMMLTALYPLLLDLFKQQVKLWMEGEDSGKQVQEGSVSWLPQYTSEQLQEKQCQNPNLAKLIK